MRCSGYGEHAHCQVASRSGLEGRKEEGKNRTLHGRRVACSRLEAARDEPSRGLSRKCSSCAMTSRCAWRAPSAARTGEKERGPFARSELTERAPCARHGRGVLSLSEISL